MKKPTITLPPPTKGELTKIPLTPEEHATEVANLEPASGALYPRPTPVETLYSGIAISGATAVGNVLYVCDAGTLKRITDEEEVLMEVGVGSTLDTIKLNEWAYFITNSGVFRVDIAGDMVSLRIPPPSAGVTSDGDLTLEVAVTELRNGYESPAVVHAASTENVRVSVTDGGVYNVYVSFDGVFYLVDTISTSSNITIPVDPIGAVLDHPETIPLPGGAFLTYFGGRMVVASGANLYVSLPYQHNLVDAVSGVVEFTGVVTFVKPLDSTRLVVGDARGVYILTFTSESATLKRVYERAPVYGSGVVVPYRVLQHGTPAPTDTVGFLTREGWHFVLPDGTIQFHPQEHDFTRAFGGVVNTNGQERIVVCSM